MSFSNKNSSLKKLISAYVATVILVALTIGIGVTLYLYFSGYVSYLETKTEETSPIKSIIECSKARIDFNANVYKLKDFKYRIPIIINNTLNSNNLEDYQVLVTINTKKLIEGEGIYELPIYISSVGTELTDYQIKINITDTSILRKISDDGRDIRFFSRSTDNPYSDTNGLLPYWIEEIIPNQRLVVWVKVPNIPASGGTTIYMYYGNLSATPMSNGDLVFEFFDDFDRTSLNTSKWTTTGYGGYNGIYYSVSGGILTIWSDNTWRILRMNKNFAPSDKIIVEVKFLKTADSSWHTNYLVQYDNVNNSRIGLLDGTYPGANMGAQIAVSGTYSYPKDFGPFSSNVWYVSRIIKSNETTLTVDAYTSDDRIFIDSYTTTQTVWSTVTWTWVAWQYQNIQVKYDWIFVRKYSSQEPTINIGSERVIAKISLGEKVRSDCGDIRFTDSDEITLLNYWIEPNTCNTENTRIWVKVPNIPANSNKIIYLYYGNLSASSMSNGDLVFEFFDDFDGTSLNTSKWILSRFAGGGSYYVTVSDGYVRIYSEASTAGGIFSIQNFSMPFIINTRWKVYLPASGREQWIGAGINVSDFIRTGYLYNTYYYEKITGNNVFIYQNFYRTAPTSWVNSVWKITNFSAIYFEDGNQVNTVITQDKFSFGSLRINFHTWNGGYMDVDLTFVRKYTSPEPTISLQTEETSPIIKLTIINLGIDLGKKLQLKLIYEDNKTETRNINLNETFKLGDFLEIPLKDLPKGKIKKIEIYCLDVCPGLLIGIKSVNIEV